MPVPEPALTSMATLQRLMTAHGVPADGLRGSGPSRRSWPGPWIAHFRESHWVVVELESAFGMRGCATRGRRR
jgi:hypothetical protein